MPPKRRDRPIGGIHFSERDRAPRRLEAPTRLASHDIPLWEPDTIIEARRKRHRYVIIARARSKMSKPFNPPNSDFERVERALVPFFENELPELSTETRDQLTAELVTAARYARGGVSVGKRGASNKALAKKIFLSGIMRALEGAGIPAKRWSKQYERQKKQYDDEEGESLFLRLARKVAKACGIRLPKDLKSSAKDAAEIQYG